MNLPTLFKQIYGTFEFSGLYSFEFVDKDRETITEIFLFAPPKSKNNTEGTRSSITATAGSNFLLDAGNSIKPFTLSGELWFIKEESPDNPVAPNPEIFENTIDGLNGFLALRWMLVRYRDYTMTRNAEVSIPSSLTGLSSQIKTLYKKVSKLVKEKTGALYDEIKVIFHDYDMDDHFYCRVANLSATQTDSKLYAIDYSIELECYEPDLRQKSTSPEIKKTTNERLDLTNTQLQEINFSDRLDSVQGEISSNTDFLSECLAISDTIDEINEENTSIQSGQTTFTGPIVDLTQTLLTSTNSALDSLVQTFLTEFQVNSYQSGDLTLDEILSFDLLFFYNALQKVKLQAQGLNGILRSSINQGETQYYQNADDYRLTTEQFEDDSNRVENNTFFTYYTVVDGDTARSVAQKTLQDSEKFIDILRINNISDNDFTDGNLIGQNIKIPATLETLSRGADNFVFEAETTDPIKFLYGTDLAVDENKNLLLSATGDLRGQTGLENAFQNVENRIQNEKGTLNVLRPNFGVSPLNNSNAPVLVNINKYINDFIYQIQSEPRVESVDLKTDKIDWSGEVLSLSADISFIGTDETREVTTNA